MSKKASKQKSKGSFVGSELNKLLKRVADTSSGELAEEITRGLVNNIDLTRKRIREARESIERGARTRRKSDRFRL
jgi:hypothetical protein